MPPPHSEDNLSALPLPTATDQKGCSGGVEPAAATVTASHARPLQHEHHRLVSVSCERSVAVVNFVMTTHHSPIPAEGKGVEPSSAPRRNRHSKAARPPVSGYLPSLSAPPRQKSQALDAWLLSAIRTSSTLGAGATMGVETVTMATLDVHAC